MSEGFELSAQQRSVWGCHRTASLPPGRCIVAIEGDVDARALQAAVGAVIRRHEILRTTFAHWPGLKLPVQVVHDAPPEPWWRGEEGPAAAPALDRGPLCSAALRREGGRHLLSIAIHPICGDARTLLNVAREVAALYAAPGGEGLEAEPIQYADVAAWQADLLAGDEGESGARRPAEPRRAPPQPLPALSLPFERERLPGDGFAPRAARGALGPAAAACLERAAAARGARLEDLLLACFCALLARAADATEVGVLVGAAARDLPELRAAMGPFEIAVPFSCAVTPEARLAALSLLARDTVRPIAGSPAAWILEQGRSGAAAAQPGLDAMAFSFLEERARFEARGVTFHVEEVASHARPFKLKLSFRRHEEGLAYALWYNAARLGDGAAELLSRQLGELLVSASEAPEAAVGELRLLGAEERAALVRGGATPAEPGGEPGERCLQELLERRAREHPDRIALVAGGARLSFGEVRERAAAVAGSLAAAGVGPGSIVGLHAERGAEAILGLLGALFAGAAYLPLSADDPAARIALILEQARPAAVLTTGALRERLPPLAAPVLLLDAPSAAPPVPAAVRCPGDALAYVIFTSGTTGRPKGVMIEHRSALNLIGALRRAVYAGAPRPVARVALNGSLAFDTSVKQVLQLLEGRALHVLGQEARLDGRAAVEYFAREDIDAVDCTPTQLEIWLDAGLLEQPAPRILLIGGEPISERLWRRLAAAPHTESYNLYGPTECTVDTTIARVRGSPAWPTVGRPVAGARVYILDDRGAPVATGCAGELCIGGAGVGRGYLGDPELTSRRFPADPFDAAPGARMYRTGDLARLWSDGRIELLRRMDAQVKIRGVRVELGEVEAQLAKHPAVEQAAAAVVGEPGEPQRLAAYVVLAPGARADAAELRAFLRERLPDPMVPSSFTPLQRMPLAPSGKIDRRALPRPAAEDAPRSAYAAPRTEAERILASIWAEVLGAGAVGIHDNFFELGGDSIMCVAVASRAREGGLLLSPMQLFEHQTVAELAASARQGGAVRAEQGAVVGEVPLTPIQARLLGRDLAEPHHWNQGVVLELRRELEADRIAEALRVLVRHHDALRLRFQREGSRWRQRIAPREDAPLLEVRDLSGVAPAAQLAEAERIGDAAQRRLDLERGPLLQAILYRFGAARPSRLQLFAHHLSTDAVSWRILVQDLERLVTRIEAGQAATLPPKTTSYKQWAERLREAFGAERLAEEARRWSALARAELRALPCDLEGGPGDNTIGDEETVTIQLGRAETAALIERSAAHHRAGLDEILLCALSAGLSRWLGDGTILVGVEGHGREEAVIGGVDLSRTVGWFTAIHPIALPLLEGAAPEELLDRVKQAARVGPGAGLGYGVLRYLTADPSLRPPPPDPAVMFNYMGQVVEASSSLFRLAEERGGQAFSPRAARAHVLEVEAVVKDGSLRVYLSYGRRLHHRETIAGLARAMQDRLAELGSGGR